MIINAKTHTKFPALGSASIVRYNGCWIGTGVRILGGGSSETGAVVAVGSVVIHNVPENVLVVEGAGVVNKTLVNSE